MMVPEEHQGQFFRKFLAKFSTYVDCVIDGWTRMNKCNCQLSYNPEVLYHTISPVLQIASATGPPDETGHIDRDVALHGFVESKNQEWPEIVHSSPVRSASQIYTALKDGEIRILELHPTGLNAQLRGDFHVAQIRFSYPKRSDDPSRMARRINHAISLPAGKPLWYTALSYTWGPPDFDREIQIGVGGDTVMITTSLYVALQHLRSSTHSVFLWIDQICINQPDTQEKEHQIPLMGLIYTHATNTVIWLGEDKESNSSLAIQTMEMVYSRLQGIDAKVTTGDFERLHLPQYSDRSWSAIRQLMRAHWFTRLWTIQEAVLSHDLFVLWGKSAVSWNDLVAWFYCLEGSGLLRWLLLNHTPDRHHSVQPTDALPTPPGGAAISVIQNERGRLCKERGLLHLLVSTRYSYATHPKDKIYGVLGLTQSKISPIYSASVTEREVYHEACLVVLPNEVYKLLSCVDHEQPLSPSWIPDWSKPRVTNALGYSTSTWHLYQAGGVTAPDRLYKSPLDSLLSDDTKSITLSGKIFDEVLERGHTNTTPILDMDDLQAAKHGLKSYVELIRKHTDREYPSTATSIYHAFWQTLAAGHHDSVATPPTQVRTKSRKDKSSTQAHNEIFSFILDTAMGIQYSLPGQYYSDRQVRGFFNLDSLKSTRMTKALEELRATFEGSLKMRRFAITRKGFFALVPRGTCESDIIVVFENAPVPFVVRRTDNDLQGRSRYTLLGEAYVHGIMKGEAMKMEYLHVESLTLV
jgi:hypothetical protein